MPPSPLSRTASFPPPVSATWIQPRALRAPLRRVAMVLLTLLLLAPVVFMAVRTEPARRNIVYWDEFDTALAMLLRLHEDPSPGKVVEEMFAINNEHRMVTSRLLFAASYAFTGTVNFIAVNVIGNASLLVLCAILIVQAGTTTRRLWMAAVLAALLFQLEHYENLMWSGASIDHFLVVLLAAASLVSVAHGLRLQGGRRSLLWLTLGAAFAALATFTLAHGVVAWAAGAGLLGHRRRYRALALWCALGAVVLAAFLLGFQLNRAQGFATVSVSGVLLVLHYWLTLLGAMPALGSSAAAPWLGAALLALVAWLARRGSLRREPVAFFLMLYAVGALALIAIGRAQLAGGVVFSRYYVLGGVAWGMAVFMLLARYSHPRRPFVLFVAVLPLLAGFNVAANCAFSASADSWVECRDRAAVRYVQHGEDGRGPLRLHPAPDHSTAILARATGAGIYHMPPVCRRRPFPANARPSARISYYVDDLVVTPRSVFVRGWAALQGIESERHKVRLVLRSGAETHLFTTVTESRPDVATATGQPGWALSGFQFVRLRQRLPQGEYHLGFLIEGPDGPEYAMTAHRLDLTGDGKALLATGD